MNLVKLKFLRNGLPSGREYSYISKSVLSVGDVVQVREAEEGKDAPKGIITAINVPESEVESFKDKLKEIVGKVCGNCETCEHLVYLGCGTYKCSENSEVVLLEDEKTNGYMWCKETRYKTRKEREE